MNDQSAGGVTAWGGLPLEKVTALISRKRVRGDGQTLAQVYLKRGALVPLHVHGGERMIYVLDGALKLRVAGEDIVVRDGEVLCIPGRAPHQIEALADTFALDLRSRGRDEGPARPAAAGSRRGGAGGGSPAEGDGGGSPADGRSASGR